MTYGQILFYAFWLACGVYMAYNVGVGAWRFKRPDCFEDYEAIFAMTFVVFVAGPIGIGYSMYTWLRAGVRHALNDKPRADDMPPYAGPAYALGRRIGSVCKII